MVSYVGCGGFRMGPKWSLLLEKENLRPILPVGVNRATYYYNNNEGRNIIGKVELLPGSFTS